MTTHPESSTVTPTVTPLNTVHTEAHTIITSSTNMTRFYYMQNTFQLRKRVTMFPQPGVICRRPALRQVLDKVVNRIQYECSLFSQILLCF